MNIIAINKPKGPTSHDIIDQVRRITGIKKVGHAGTLDPLASGVLVVAIGREATKSLQEYVKKEKEYIATIKLGANSETDDEEGTKTEIKLTDEKPSLENITEIVKKYIGKIQQVPPKYSALKIKGKAAYKYARKGEEIEMKSREVEIKNIKILFYQWPMLTLGVTTGPGVYIRSLARDVGKELGTGGYLADLVRTRVGDFKIKDAIEVREVGSKIDM